MVRLLIVTFAAVPLLWVNPRPADACGVKVSVKPSKIERARIPKAAEAERTPIAAGPVDTRKRTRTAAGGAETAQAKPAPPRPARAATPSPARAKATPAEETQVAKAPVEKAPVEKAPVKKAPVKKAPARTEVAAVDEDDSASDDAMPDLSREEDTSDEQPARPAKFNERVFFSSASTSLSSRNQAKLAANARWMQQNPDKTITVEGHANTRGNPDDNRVLSEMRAQAVKDYLVERGVDASRINVTFFGSDRPEFSPGTSGKNRRVVITVD